MLATLAVGCRLPASVTTCDNNRQCPDGYFCNTVGSYCVAIPDAAIDAAAADHAGFDQGSDSGAGDGAPTDNGARDRGPSDRAALELAAGERQDLERVPLDEAVLLDGSIGEVGAFDSAVPGTDAALGFDASCACRISNNCHDYHERSSTNVCQWCDPAIRTNGWADVNAAFCYGSTFYACASGYLYDQVSCPPGQCDAPSRGCCGSAGESCCAGAVKCAAGACTSTGICAASCGDDGLPCCFDSPICRQSLGCCIDTCLDSMSCI